MSSKPYYKQKNIKTTKHKNNLVLIVFPIVITLVLLFVFYNPQATSAEIDAKEYTNLQKGIITTQESEIGIETETTEETEPPINIEYNNYPEVTENTIYLNSEFSCEYGLLVDTQTHEVLVAKGNPNQRIYPASMTKIMTLLVAVENIENLDDTFLMTNEILYPLNLQDASVAGFLGGENVTMRDLLYGLALPSGADAAVAIADYVAGSEEEFAVLMNEKVEELGLKNTHFVTTSGLHDENHYSTLADIAVILQEAMDNNLCRQILSTYQYRTESTDEHPNGILLTSTMFSRMKGNEDEDIGVDIVGGKTGYTNEAGHCLASFARKDGKEYIAVLGKGGGKYSMIYDTIDIYRYLD